MRTAALIPAFQAEHTIARVVENLAEHWPRTEGPETVLVVDDGSTDNTAERARKSGALVVSHGFNRGKGAALRTGLRVARDLGYDVVVAVDADGQHPAAEARRLADYPCDPRALVLGVRDLHGAGAPRANKVSNRISNFFLSVFSGRVLADTQCGLRRYPVRETLALDPRDSGYAIEAEILLLALRAGLPVVEVPIHVIYPAGSSHFHVVKDPARIITRVLITLGRSKPDLPEPLALEPSASVTTQDAALPCDSDL